MGSGGRQQSGRGLWPRMQIRAQHGRVFVLFNLFCFVILDWDHVYWSEYSHELGFFLPLLNFLDYYFIINDCCHFDSQNAILKYCSQHKVTSCIAHIFAQFFMKQILH